MVELEDDWTNQTTTPSGSAITGPKRHFVCASGISKILQKKLQKLQSSPSQVGCGDILLIVY